MFCQKCGKEIPDNSDFCRYCGLPLQSNSVGGKSWYNDTPQGAVAKPRKQRKKGKALVIVLLVICSFIFVLSMLNNKPSNNISDDSVTEINKTVYSENGIEMTVTSISGTEYLNFNIVNNSSEDVYINIPSIAVSGCTVDNGWISSVAAGKTAVGKCKISDFKDYGISAVNSIEMYIDISGDKISDTSVVSLLLSESDSTLDLKEDPVYSDSKIDVYIVNRSLEKQDKTVDIICRNKTKHSVSIGFSNLSANDVMISSIQSGKYVLPGAYKMYNLPSDIIMFNQALESANIDTVNKLCGKLNLIEVDSSSFSSDDLYETDEITFFDVK